MARGDRIHKLAEAYIKGQIPAKMPEELQSFSALFKELRAMYKKRSESMVVEDMWAFTRDWTETGWRDWDGCWLRLKLDCAYHEENGEYDTLILRDWKTGKFREDKNDEYLEQQDLYALAAFLLHDHIKIVKPRLNYLDHGIEYGAGMTSLEKGMELVYTRAQVPALKKTWEKRVKAMMADTTFAPRPNNLCRWCHYRAENGGPCQY